MLINIEDIRSTNTIRKRRDLTYTYSLKEGQIVPIYEDWDIESCLIGKAKLIKKLNVNSYEFIPDGSYPVNKTPVFTFERWIMYLIDRKCYITWNKRVLLRIGRPYSTELRNTATPLLEDKFIIVNGREVF